MIALIDALEHHIAPPAEHRGQHSGEASEEQPWPLMPKTPPWLVFIHTTGPNHEDKGGHGAYERPGARRQEMVIVLFRVIVSH